jgi:ribonuclease-3
MSTELESRLGYKFIRPELLQVALTHRSYYFENKDNCPGHFERLEFLGDAVLDLILSEVLFNGFKDVGEGTLSKWRASLVNEVTLGQVARSLELEKYLYLGRSEAAQREKARARLLASAFEAVIAALYLDGGPESARQLIIREFASRVATLDAENEFATDFKTRLQEWSQKRHHLTPEYKLVETQGPEHAKIFRFEVRVAEQTLGTGEGGSRKAAEQDAARQALAKLTNEEK